MGGKLHHHIAFSLLECPACKEYIEVPAEINCNPEEFIVWRERQEQIHALKHHVAQQWLM